PDRARRGHRDRHHVLHGHTSAALLPNKRPPQKSRMLSRVRSSFESLLFTYFVKRGGNGCASQFFGPNKLPSFAAPNKNYPPHSRQIDGQILRTSLGLRSPGAQLTIGPCRRVGRVQRTHWRGDWRRRIDDADALVHPEHLVRPRRKRRCFPCARPVV